MIRKDYTIIFLITFSKGKNLIFLINSKLTQGHIKPQKVHSKHDLPFSEDFPQGACPDSFSAYQDGWRSDPSALLPMQPSGHHLEDHDWLHSTLEGRASGCPKAEQHSKSILDHSFYYSLIPPMVSQYSFWKNASTFLPTVSVGMYEESGTLGEIFVCILRFFKKEKIFIY